MQKTSSMRETAVSPRLASMAKLQDAVEDSSESLDQTNISAVEGDQTAEGDQIAEPEEEAAKHELRSVESSHRTVEVDSEVSPYTRMGYITWRCNNCDIWRVPGAPFSLVGDARIFNAACSFGDTGVLCCNCERMKELLLWKGKTIELFREGVKMFSPPQMLFDRDAVQVIWDRNEHSMQAYVEIMKEAKPLQSSTSRPAWYSEMACNHCRARAGLKTHEEIAKQKALDAHQRMLDAMASKGKKGKKGGKKKGDAKAKKKK